MKIRKPIFAFLILVVLTAILATATVLICFKENDRQTSSRNELVSENAVHSLKMIEKEMNRVFNTTKQRTEDGVNLTVTALKNLFQGNNYSGLRIFDDGVVVQIVNNQIVYPEDFPYFFETEQGKLLDAEMLWKGLLLEPFRLVQNDNEGYITTAITTKKSQMTTGTSI